MNKKINNVLMLPHNNVSKMLTLLTKLTQLNKFKTWKNGDNLNLVKTKLELKFKIYWKILKQELSGNVCLKEPKPVVVEIQFKELLFPKCSIMEKLKKNNVSKDQLNNVPLL